MGEAVVGGGGMEAEVVVRAEEAVDGREIDDKGGSSEVVRWEKFLPRMVLRVLLVEADDSTRQIISALLRKCSYKVAAVPDGLMAWETLKGRPHNIDLILTEVELPSISGYALLTLVMEHDICKNIPVIMMSSHDSISTVLKCMLKGAADFLIKPVRRNELRNLWQHVWRRQAQLTAGHIPHDSPYTQHKVEAGSDNNSASDHSSECATSSRKRKECSDEGSDLQMEFQITEKEKYKVFDVSDEKSIIPDKKARDTSTRIGSLGASLSEDHNSTGLELGEEFTCSKRMIQDEDVKLENNRENINISRFHNEEMIESSGGAIDLIGTFDDGPKLTYRLLQRHDASNKFAVTPELELSLTRFFHNDSKNQGVEGRDALNHSNASAFSWYNGKVLQPLFPTSTNKSTEFKENVRETQDPSLDTKLHVSQETATNLAIGQSAEAELAYQNTQQLINPSETRLDNNCNSQPTACQPNTVQQQGRSPKIASQQQHSEYPIGTPIHSNPEIKVQLENGTAMNSVSQNMHKPNNTEVADQMRQNSPASGYSRSSSISNSAADHTNGSFTSRSDGNVGFAVTPEKANGPESLNDRGHLFARDGFRGMDALRSSQREAALTKFRLKRKDRCYEKKVRYQSRKRLAEQRPRVKGQFVRQVPNDAPIGDANC